MQLNIILPLVESKNSRLDVIVAKYDAIKNWSCVRDGDSTIVDIEPDRTVNVAMHPDAFTQMMHKLATYVMAGGNVSVTYSAFDGRAVTRSVGSQPMYDTYLTTKNHLKAHGDSLRNKAVVGAVGIAFGKLIPEFEKAERPYHAITCSIDVNSCMQMVIDNLNLELDRAQKVVEVNLHYHGPRINNPNLPKQIILNSGSGIYFDSEMSDDPNTPVSFTVEAAL